MPNATSLILSACIAGAALVALPACDTTGNSSDMTTLLDNVQDRILGDWTLDALNGVDADSLLAAAGLDRAPNLSIAEDGRVSGFAGVNRLSSGLDLSKLSSGAFDLSPAAVTRMAGPPEAAALEQDFLSALSNATSLDPSALTDGVLRLLGENGQELLRFIRPA